MIGDSGRFEKHFLPGKSNKPIVNFFNYITPKFYIYILSSNHQQLIYNILRIQDILIGVFPIISYSIYN